MKKKVFIVGIVSVVVFVFVLLFAAYRYFAPSNVKREMGVQYKNLKKGELMLVVNDEVLNEKGLIIDNHNYVPVEVLCEQYNTRFYWDSKEHILCYVKPDGLMQVRPDEKNYTMGIESKESEFPIIRNVNAQYYVSLDFAVEYSVSTVKTYKNPARVVAITDFEKQYSFGTLSESTRLRVGPNKKYDYLEEIKSGTQVILIDEKTENDYEKVMTPDGIVGYIPNDSYKKVAKTWKTSKSQPVFKQLKTVDKVCLGWHQVTNMATNQYLSSVISSAHGMNVVSPTWFALTDNKGNMTSYGSLNYVNQAHAANLKVWALVNDFNKNVNLRRLLGRTSSRQQLINRLIANALEYQVDGINIDFERVHVNEAPAFLEFLRELSLKCHSNQLVLSVDNYKPESYNSHYNLSEQGKIVDYVIIMSYDEHHSGSEEAGSVSSLNFVKSAAQKTLEQVDKERVVIALPYYTRLWKTNKNGRLSSSAYGMDGAERILKQNGAMAKWDDETGQYYAEFKSNKDTYQIWMEEEKSLETKMKEVKDAGINNYAFWKLGFERAAAWNVVEKYVK